ncbi:MAG: hypothetical protein LBN20_03875 [Endomicrobium sp.]|jgi:Mg2+ and Co2+ transporter CorA|nr:hypothetical protein [Endomicrobium sp.]
MNYNVFCDILNKQIFDESKKDLLKKIANYPDRYVGLFRPTKPTAKVIQNLLQSHEIRFGNALEILFEKYFRLLNYTVLDKSIVHNNESLALDQLFKDGQFVYFVEQKVRDDHDSTKKCGQIENFEKKINALLDSYNEKKLKCFMYFIDPSLVKNRKYYNAVIEKMKSDYNIFIKLHYGQDFWEEIGHIEVWDEINSYLARWKKNIPDIPSVNFDENAGDSFNEIKFLSVAIFRKLFDNKEICSEILPIISPEKKVLKLLLNFFKESSNKKSIYKSLAESIKRIIQV